MRKPKKRSSDESSHAPSALLIAVFGGACSLIASEVTVPDVMESWGRKMDRLPAWQVHRGSVCIGIIAFFICLLILETRETKSRIAAWRSSAPWLPLIGLTAVATIIHIPFYLVILAGSAYCIWAYRQSSGARRSLRLP
jgi:hypothetical protein